jgi:hypothetical protein
MSYEEEERYLIEEVIVFAKEQGVFLLRKHKHHVSRDSARQLVGLT